MLLLVLVRLREFICFQIGSHPNVYVLDTPGIFPPNLYDAEICAKLALTGLISTKHKQNDYIPVKVLFLYSHSRIAQRAYWVGYLMQELSRMI